MKALAAKVVRIVGGTALLCSAALVSAQQRHDQTANSQQRGAPVLAEGTLLRVAFASKVDWARVPRGSQLEGTLSFPLFAGIDVAVPSGSTVRLKIASSERIRHKRGFWNATGHTIVRAFNPLERTRAPEYHVELSSADLVLLEGTAIPLRATVLRAGSDILVEAHETGQAAASKEPSDRSYRGNHRRPASAVVLRLAESAPLAAKDLATAASHSPEDHTAIAFLLSSLSASQSREGETFQAWLAEPMKIGDHVFQAGSLLQGAVVRSAPPRMLSRAGELYIRFNQVTSKDGQTAHVTGNLAAAEADSQTRFVLDEEGLARGRKPGVKEGLVDLGIAFALGKVSDDIAETPIRAIGASMSDAAVASAARYVGLASALTFLVTRHGRDVYLPPYSQISVEFGRVSEPPAPSPTASADATK